MEKKILEIDGKYLVKFYNGYGDVVHKVWFDSLKEAEKHEYSAPVESTTAATVVGEVVITKPKKVKKTK
jgi:hypothetical protein